MELEAVRSQLANPSATDIDPLDVLRDIEDSPLILIESNLPFISSLTTLDYKQLLSAFDLITSATQSILEPELDVANVILFNYVITRLLCTSYKELHLKKKKSSPFNIDAYLVNLEQMIDMGSQPESVLMAILDLFQFDLILFNIPHMNVASILIKCFQHGQSSNYSTCIPTILNTSDANITQFAHCLNELYALDDDAVYCTTMEVLTTLDHKSLSHLLSYLYNESFYQQLPITIQFFNNSNPHVRMAMIQSSTQLIINNKSFDNPHDLQHVLDSIIDHMHDVYATCRSKSISCISDLIDRQLFPLNQYLSITELILQRVKDKSHFTRKAALKAIPVLIKHHPFDKDGGCLNINSCNSALQILEQVEDPETEITNSPEFKQLLTGFDTNGASTTDTYKIALVYYQSFFEFIQYFIQITPLFIQMLNNNKSEIILLIDIIHVLVQYEFNPAILKSILNLIWSKDASYNEDNVKSYIFKTLQNHFIIPNNPNITCKRLIEFYYTCNDVDLISFATVLQNIEIPNPVVHKLSQIISNSSVPKQQIIASAFILHKLDYSNFKFSELVSIYANSQCFIIIELMQSLAIKSNDLMGWASTSVATMSMNSINSLVQLIFIQPDCTTLIPKLLNLEMTTIQRIYMSSVIITNTIQYITTINHKYHAIYSNNVDKDNVMANMDDVFIQFIEGILETELYNNNELFKGYADLLSFECRRLAGNSGNQFDTKTTCVLLYAFGKYMCGNEQYCKHHMDLYLFLIHKYPSTTATGMILLGEMITQFSNTCTPYVDELFKGLSSTDHKVVVNALLQSTRLILQGMIKPNKYMGYLSGLLINENTKIREITRGFFIELNSKKPIYNNIMDIVTIIIGHDQYLEMMGWLMGFIKLQGHVDSILSRLLLRIGDNKDVHDLLLTIELLPFGDGGHETYLSKMMTQWKYYKDGLKDAEMNDLFISIIKKKLKNLKIESKLNLEEFVKMVVGYKQEDIKIPESPQQKRLNKTLKRLSLSGMQSDAESSLGGEEDLEDIMEE